MSSLADPAVCRSFRMEMRLVTVFNMITCSAKLAVTPHPQTAQAKGWIGADVVNGDGGGVGS